MATLSELETQIRKLQRRADTLREKRSREIIATIQSLMQQYGLTIADLTADVEAGAVKRGRPLGSKNRAKPQGSPVGSRLPPKYRDPLSGATWSGHARPPSWIKNAADRSVFLIDKPNSKSVAKKADMKVRRSFE
ncbi:MULTISPECIES: H-NS histone family protein [unclassified Caballeronia]|uniref:H-NS histone family protein n=1 Tax=unclassified Caballeronia TaxID=2646786 RepID=UPI0028636CD2|nr:MULTISPECIES: H-NS histone family protein [unclassified Caballeronia]MDR5740694.1 H-NS histone family protein [Caballeronia sp. LZ016]MDR5808783.1 H-NS histone family protein [Caballeronia sp. LZ019]